MEEETQRMYVPERQMYRTETLVLPKGSHRDQKLDLLTPLCQSRRRLGLKMLLLVFWWRLSSESSENTDALIPNKRQSFSLSWSLLSVQLHVSHVM